MRIQFFVPGDAKTSGSKKGFVHKVIKRVVLVPASKKQRKWQDRVSDYARQALLQAPINEPLILTCIFYRKRPDSHYQTRNGKITKELKPGRIKLLPGSKPDSLKLGRAVEDAMNKVIYGDDGQICDHHISKRYCIPGIVPGVKIIIETYDERKEPIYVEEEKNTGTCPSLF